jgi:hypothetical protein
MKRVVGLALMVALLAGSCSGGNSDPVAHAWALVRYWADTTGSVSDPDSGPTSVSEVNDIATSAWPNDPATAAQFVNLYNHLSTSESDAQYSVEASPFLAANCSSKS